MDRLFDLVTIFSLVLIVWVLSSVRRSRIRVEYSVSWLLAGAVLLVLAQWRSFDDWAASVLGIPDSFFGSSDVRRSRVPDRAVSPIPSDLGIEGF
jgi:hypothetical protein